MLNRLVPALIGGASHIAPRTIGNWAATQVQIPRRTRKGRAMLAEPDSLWHRQQGCFRRWGSSTQPVALMIHGWEGHHSQLHIIGSALRRKGFAVVTVDPPAHGDADGDKASPQHFADALKAAAAIVGPIKLLVGHSMGGLAATLAVRQGLDASHLVTISAPADVASTITGIADWLRLSPAARRYMRDNIERFAGVAITQVDVENTLSNFSGQLLVTHDRKDRKISVEHAERIRNNRPNAQLFLTSGLGHTRLLEDNALCEKILNFADSATAY